MTRARGPRADDPEPDDPEPVTPSPSTGPAREPRPGPDAVHSLLAQLGAEVVDEGYREAAAARGPGVGPRRSLWLLTVGLLLVGLLLATAAGLTRSRAPALAAARESLAAEAERRTTAADSVATRVAALQAEVARARLAALSQAPAGSSALNLELLEVVAGSVPVTGAGARVVVDDARRAEPEAERLDRVGPGGSDAGRVLDRDLQVVANGLFQAGAEAVTINGQRLTSLSAIRSAGSAILVDYRPLSPPYRVEAIGNPESLATEFSDGPAGRYLNGLKDNYGVRFQVSRQARVQLAGSSGLTLYHAASSEQAGVATPQSTPERMPRPSASLR